MMLGSTPSPQDFSSAKLLLELIANPQSAREYLEKIEKEAARLTELQKTALSAIEQSERAQKDALAVIQRAEEMHVEAVRELDSVEKRKKAVEDEEKRVDSKKREMAVDIANLQKGIDKQRELLAAERASFAAERDRINAGFAERREAIEKMEADAKAALADAERLRNEADQKLARLKSAVVEAAGNA